MVDQKRLALEKKTAAITLSDMEIFIFPELMIAGALANLMSPIVWEWRNDPYFKDMDRLSQYQRILKVKQYIIDHFVFNLDLETWGLTTKERERRRFQQFVNFKDVEESNALMGYEGDHYYYDICNHPIEKHQFYQMLDVNTIFTAFNVYGRLSGSFAVVR